MTWGYALLWAKQFLTRDEDPWMAKLKFLREYGLQTTGIGLGEWADMEEARRDRIAQYLSDNDLRLTLGVHADWYDDGDIDLEVSEICDQLDRYAHLARAPICTTSGGGKHRFMRKPPLEAQLETLAFRLAPVARHCHEIGVPLGIENHGDYYVSDLAGLCLQVPHLGIFLDTGNTYLIGEQPLPAFRQAAPFTVGTHFKDQKVAPRPDARPLNFEVDVAVPGQGDVPLRECYDILRRECPNFDRLAMQIELIPKSFAGNDPLDAFEQALSFVRSLETVPV
ncbi:MAG TPA: sugar phosphate isomerase/epimerase family protein [Fimbriimonas sp.]